MQDETRNIPTDQIVEPWVILRVVNRASVEYLELRDSLADKGFFNSICVRPSPRVADKMEVVDGLYRFTAANELRLPVVPCIVKYNLTDEDVLAAQIQANALRPETTPMEYARQLRKIMASMPDTMTLAELSVRVHKNPEWLGDQLSLLKLLKEVQKAVERGEIPLATAYALARVPIGSQRQFLDVAKMTPAKELVPILNAFVKRHRESVRQGRQTDLLVEFEPVPFLRRLTEVLAEYKGRLTGGLTLARATCVSPVEAWYLALQWVLHLDEKSVNEQREKVLQRQRTAVLKREEEEDEP
jgi:ParB/RepB/Spo0J family partition protein